MTNQKQHYLTKWHDKHTNIRAESVWICLDSIGNVFFHSDGVCKDFKFELGWNTLNLLPMRVCLVWLQVDWFFICTQFFKYCTFLSSHYGCFFIPYQAIFNFQTEFWVKLSILLMYNIDLILNMFACLFFFWPRNVSWKCHNWTCWCKWHSSPDFSNHLVHLNFVPLKLTAFFFECNILFLKSI